MTRGISGKQTPAQLAAYGHIAVALREVLKQRSWTVPDLSQAIGRGRSYPPSYLWVAGKAAPGKKMREVVAKALGLDASQLVPRKGASARLADQGRPQASRDLVVHATANQKPGRPPATPLAPRGGVQDQPTFSFTVEGIGVPVTVSVTLGRKG